MIKTALGITLAGHIVLGISDCLMAYGKKGRLNMKNLADNEKMSADYEHVPLSYPAAAILTGVYAVTAMAFGYLALAAWMEAFSHIASVIMYISAVIFLISIVVHHEFCGLPGWFYVRLGRTEEARKAVLDFFKKTLYAMATGYAAWAVFSVTLLVMVLRGQTSLPQWACIFNVLPCYLVIAPTKLPAKGNIAEIMMFLGLLFLL